MFILNQKVLTDLTPHTKFINYDIKQLDHVFISTDANGIVTGYSQSFLILTGLESNNVIGQNLDDIFIHPENDLPVFKLIQKEIRKSGIFCSDVTLKTNYNKLINITVSSLHNNSSKINGYNLLLIDWNQNFSQHALLKQISKLEKKIEELEQFTHQVSHDLQEPVRSLVSITDLMKMEIEIGNNYKTPVYLKFINDSSRRMQSLIKTLLEYVKIGHQRKLALINSRELIDETIIDLQQALKEKNVKFEIGELPIIMGYELELRLLIQNLISNALKYNKQNSEVIIKISASKDENEDWVFCIQDNGIGIAKENQQSIFKLFKRLHTDEYPGNGIGLAYAKKIANLHEGDIWVDSELGKGSKFYFTISSIN